MRTPSCDDLQFAISAGNNGAALSQRRTVLKDAFNDEDLFAVCAQRSFGATVKNPSDQSGEADDHGQRGGADQCKCVCVHEAPIPCPLTRTPEGSRGCAVYRNANTRTHV
ncbi:hypothetical protein XAC3612_3050001 [Xanthomonas citri pv. citri]|nr:hypothetical protein XAC3612_3050001 [Xanthomonas citri pv. citri]